MIFRLAALSIAFILTACATVPEVYDTRFTRLELADLTAQDFDLEADAAAKALRSTYKKYGAPHAYIFGQMSSVSDPTLSRLYGSGEVRSKTRLDTHTFWAIEGTALSGHLEPIKTAHLVYDIDRLDNLTETLGKVGSLSARGKVFTIFEREVDGQIVVTLHRTDDLPEQSDLNTLTFFAR